MLKMVSLQIQKLTLKLLKALGYLCFGLFGILNLIGIFLSPFEYDEGFRDIDQLEVLTLLLIVFLTWRFFKVGVRNSIAKWLLIKRYTLIMAFILLIVNTVSYFTLMGMIVTQGVVTEAFLASSEDISVTAWGLFTCILIYGFTPLPAITEVISHKADCSGSATDSEESFSHKQKAEEAV